MEKLLTELKEKGFLNEKDSSHNIFSIGFMEDEIRIFDDVDKFKGFLVEGEDLSDSKEFYDEVDKVFKQNKKILWYDEWGKVIKVNWIRQIVWNFLQRNKDYILMISYSDSGCIKFNEKVFYWSRGDFEINEDKDLLKDKYKFVYGGE